jgi:hypothetical protein
MKFDESDRNFWIAYIIGRQTKKNRVGVKYKIGFEF